MRPLVEGLYTIIIGDSIVDLIAKVNHHIQEGWVPQGSPYKESPRDWYQAMTRPLIVNPALVV